jgi:hypothetical protein
MEKSSHPYVRKSDVKQRILPLLAFTITGLWMWLGFSPLLRPRPVPTTEKSPEKEFEWSDVSHSPSANNTAC